MLTVLVATYNRAETFAATLEAFTQLASPLGGWKLVVIDNASTDRTREVVLSFQSRLPLTYLYEGQPGKTRALNQGLAHLEGDVAVFTDDDVFPRADWLVQLRRAADEHPDFALFGGTTLPRWSAPVPEWLAWVDRGPVFAVSDPQLKEGPASPGTIYGNHMAIRAGIFAQGIRFDTDIGPRGESYAMGDEAELLNWLGSQGYKAWHAPDAVVEHFIRKDQSEEQWVYGRYERVARGEYHLHRLHHPETLPSLFIFFLKLVMRVAVWMKACILGGREERFRARCAISYVWGHLVQGMETRNTQPSSARSRA